MPKRVIQNCVDEFALALGEGLEQADFLMLLPICNDQVKTYLKRLNTICLIRYFWPFQGIIFGVVRYFCPF
jgi:hypothetical protein